MSGWEWFWTITVAGAMLITGGISLFTSIGGFIELKQMFQGKQETE
jgi:hypothetical protein